MKKPPPKWTPPPPLPGWKRKGALILGVLLLLAAIVSYVKGFQRAEEGDLQVRVQAASRSLYTQTVSNAWSRASFVLLIFGSILLGKGLWRGEKKAGLNEKRES